MIMKKYKVCKLVKGRVLSPIQRYDYGEEAELFNKPLKFRFNDSERECAEGFYATGVDGLVYNLNRTAECRVYEVEVGGRFRIFDDYHQRFSEATFIRRLTDDEVIGLIKNQSDKIDYWNCFEACFPQDPREIESTFDKKKVLGLLKEWASIWEFVKDPEREPIGGSPWGAIREAVWNPVKSLVRESICASGAALAPWQYGVIDRATENMITAYISFLKPNENTFLKSGYALWRMGIIPSFDGNTWRLHKGKKMDVIYAIPSTALQKIKIATGTVGKGEKIEDPSA